MREVIEPKDASDDKDVPENEKEIREAFKKMDDADKGVWKAAADSWRFPYWDWATKQVYDSHGSLPVVTEQYAIPVLCSLDTVQIWPPSGLVQDYPNPLAKFENPEKDPGTNKPRMFGHLSDMNKRFNIKDDGKDVPDPDPKKVQERMPVS